MNIDLIIPYYNNLEGLKKTIESIELDIFEITIVDDGSDEQLEHVNKDIHVLVLPENRGPGYARQYGLMHTSNPYVMFIDAGDTFTDDMAQHIIQNLIEKNEDVNMFSFVYNHYNSIANPRIDNRMHGKVYKREFLEKYDISFCPKSSYMNEDIGFNRTCRLILNQSDPKEILFSNVAVINQNFDENSLTQKDNRAALYRDQTRALSLVSIHTINICELHNFDTTEEIAQIAASLYYWFVRTAAERPEFLPMAWAGVKIFFDAYGARMSSSTMNYITGAMMSKLRFFKTKIPFHINFPRFFMDIRTYSHIPPWYLTKV